MDPLFKILLDYGSAVPSLVFIWLWITGRIAHPREVKAAMERASRAESQVDAQTGIINHLADQVGDLLEEQKALRALVERITPRERLPGS